jgi:probable blue pigment (indigoidine) exporter
MTGRALCGAIAGIVGVLLLVGGASGGIDPLGVAASAAALLLSSAGAVLGKRWSDGTPLIALTAWQLVLGGSVLATVALVVEGAPPALDARETAGFAFTTLVATALAYLCWFAGLARLPAATVGVVGLLNPVTGVLLGALVVHETFTMEQLAGIVLVLTGIVAASRSSVGSGAAAHSLLQAREVPVGEAVVPPLLADHGAQAALHGVAAGLRVAGTGHGDLA